jgi:hypothetical protein
VRTARTARISREAMKSRGACQWGGWGRLSDEGPGQHNPARSEGPWGVAVLDKCLLRHWAEITRPPLGARRAEVNRLGRVSVKREDAV